MPDNLPEKYINPALLTDEGYIETEELLFEMQAELESVYGIAYTQLKEKAEKYLAWFIAMDEAKRKLYEEQKISIEEYQTWRRTHLMQGQHHYAMTQTLSDYLTNVDKIAASVVNGYMPEVYAINGNYIRYKVDKEFGINVMFDLIDEHTVERLVRDKPDLLPKAKINIPDDKRWNKQHLNSAILQGILQGETVDQIADRLAEVSDMNHRAAIRNAKTMTTSAQNGGRMDGFKWAQDIGVKGLKTQWISTLDGHTRSSHRQVDGEIREYGKKFSNGLLYPGDPNGKPEELYNCRCTITGVFDDSNYESIKDRNNRINRMGTMSYEQWKTSKGKESLFKAAKNVNIDLKMHEEYMELLGSKVPKNFDDFQKLKYNSPDKWKSMVSDARKARNKNRKGKG